jgi:hypothetical protein
LFFAVIVENKITTTTANIKRYILFNYFYYSGLNKGFYLF